MLGRDAITFIGDTYLHAATGRGGDTGQAHPDRGAVATIFQRIGNQVVEHLKHLVAIGNNARQIGRLVDQKGALIGFQPHGQCAADFGDQAFQVERLSGAHELVQLDARQAHQIVDQAAHAIGFGGHDGEETLARRFILGRRAL